VTSGVELTEEKAECNGVVEERRANVAMQGRVKHNRCNRVMRKKHWRLAKLAKDLCHHESPSGWTRRDYERVLREATRGSVSMKKARMVETKVTSSGRNS